MTTAAEIIAYPLLAWWVMSPFVSLAIGARRGHPFYGWCCGLVPVVGVYLALQLPDDRDR